GSRPAMLARRASSSASLPNNGPPAAGPAIRRRVMWSVGPRAASVARSCSVQTRIRPFAPSCCATRADTSAAATIRACQVRITLLVMPARVAGIHVFRGERIKLKRPAARLVGSDGADYLGCVGAHNPFDEFSNRIFDLLQLKIRGQHSFRA